jgi:hypothetical protein
MSSNADFGKVGSLLSSRVTAADDSQRLVPKDRDGTYNRF